jgi:hypothetical protein
MGGHYQRQRNIMQALILSGDIAQAGLRRMQAYRRTCGPPAFRRSGKPTISWAGWEGDFESGQATIFEAAANIAGGGRHSKAADYKRAWIPDIKKIDYGPERSQVLQMSDAGRLNAARMKARQGRLANGSRRRGVLLARR